MGHAVIYTQCNSFTDDFPFGQVQEGGLDFENGCTNNPGLSAKVCHSGKGLKKFGSAVGITGIVNRVYTDENILCAEDLGTGDGMCQENRVSGRDIGDGDIRTRMLNILTFGNLNIVCQGRTADFVKIKSEYQMPGY